MWDNVINLYDRNVEFKILDVFCLCSYALIISVLLLLFFVQSCSVFYKMRERKLIVIMSFECHIKHG